MGNKVWIALLSVIVIIGMVGVYQFGAMQGKKDVLEQEAERGKKYGVAAAHPLAVDVGMDILEQGGNAVDAAVAVSYALGVVEPFGSGIGGGGTMLIYPAGGQKPVVIDYREMAPSSGYIPESGVGVPGMVKGMELAHNEFGSMPMAKLIEPSIQLAEEGFEVTPLLTRRLEAARGRLPVGDLPHFFPDGEPVQPGQLLQQKELARTLRAIQKKGSDAFYKGEIARDIVRAVGGIRASDLKAYKPEEKEPVRGTFAGYEVVSAAPPSGGVMLIQSLQMAEHMHVDQTRELSADFIHLVGEINKRAYQERMEKMGDPRFVQVPVEEMVSEEHTRRMASDIDMDKLSDKYKEAVDSLADREDHDNTTHFVIVDGEGNMVSVTNTLSNFFGSGVYVDGFFLNNQLKNFSFRNDSPNRAQPGKRPISYTAPTILAKDGEPIIGIGSAGGRRIPPMLTEVLIRMLKYHEPIQTAINEPRFLVEGNEVFVEKDLPEDVKRELRRRGYTVTVKGISLFYGGIQGLVIDKENQRIDGGADPRRDGAWKAGP